MTDYKNNGFIVPVDICRYCNRPQPVYAKITEEGILTYNYSGMCKNKNCPMYLDPLETPSWIPVDGDEFKQIRRRLTREINNVS